MYQLASPVTEWEAPGAFTRRTARNSAARPHHLLGPSMSRRRCVSRGWCRCVLTMPEGGSHSLLPLSYKEVSGNSNRY